MWRKGKNRASLFCFVLLCYVSLVSVFISLYLSDFFFKANAQKGRETGQNPHGRIILCLSRCSSRPSMLGAVRNEGAWHRIQTARRRRRFELVSFDFDFDADRYANVRLYIFLALICLSVGLVWRAERFLTSIGGLILCNEIQIKSP